MLGDLSFVECGSGRALVPKRVEVDDLLSQSLFIVRIHARWHCPVWDLAVTLSGMLGSKYNFLDLEGSKSDFFFLLSLFFEGN